MARIKTKRIARRELEDALIEACDYRDEHGDIQFRIADGRMSNLRFLVAVDTCGEGIEDEVFFKIMVSNENVRVDDQIFSRAEIAKRITL